LINDTDDPIDNIFRGLPERLNVIKRGINPDVQQAYLEYADSIDDAEYAGQNALVKGQKLLSAETSPDEVPAKGQAIFPTLSVTIAEQQEILRPDIVIIEPDDSRQEISRKAQRKKGKGKKDDGQLTLF